MLGGWFGRRCGSGLGFGGFGFEVILSFCSGGGCRLGGFGWVVDKFEV